MRRKWTQVIVSLALVTLGGLCIHYTSAEDADHHRRWAEEHHLPPPKSAITGIGWALVGAGAAVLVYSVAPGRKSRAH